MQSLAPSLPPVRADAPEEIPVLDLADYLAGVPGALQRLGAELRRAFEEIGFYFIVGHGVPQSLVDAAFAAAERFHAQPLEDKLAIRMDGGLAGYLPVRGSTTRHSRINPNNKPNVNEAFFARREDGGAPNRWPANLAGFRETAIAYQAAMEQLGKSLLPLYAVALDLPPDYFEAAFTRPMYTLRMSHYPQQDEVVDNEFGLAPHTDTSFMTMLAQNKVPGLSIRLPTGRWVDAPAIDGAFLVNGGDLLRRWTNDRFLATPHRVVNRSGRERYAIPFFFDCGNEVVMDCLPTCREPGQPPRYEPITYAAYMDWYRQLNFGQAKDRSGVTLSAY
jgi:isopenicillin N synthase-like dioxygenase